MLAVIASGHTGAAEVLYLIAAILFGLATVIQLVSHTGDAAFVPAGLCLVAVALLIL